MVHIRMAFLQANRITYNTIKDQHWYVVQGIRHGGNDDAHSCFFVRTIKKVASLLKGWQLYTKEL